jgi:hypothetical protein
LASVDGGGMEVSDVDNKTSFCDLTRAVMANLTMAAAFEAEVNLELSNELVGVNGFILVGCCWLN